LKDGEALHDHADDNGLVCMQDRLLRPLLLAVEILGVDEAG
jgi:hypothetical protein